MIKNAKRLDKILIILAEIYIFLPVVIFMYGWTRYIIASIVTLLIIFLALKINEELRYKEICVFNKKIIVFWAIALISILLWVYLSGIGCYSFQNSDHYVRNPIFNDLSTHSWPVIYDLSEQSHIIQEICGESKVAFSYYIAWWLPVSFISKIFHFSMSVRNFLLYCWAVCGILLIVYLLCRRYNRIAWPVMPIVIFFGGLDIIPYLIFNRYELFAHIENWASFFQYSSNTVQLFWVFNQSIPIWIIMALFIHVDNPRYSAAFLSIAFAYSPWATMGIVPYALYQMFHNRHNRQNIKDVFNYVNIIIPLSMLTVFGSFYLAGDGAKGEIGFQFIRYRNEISHFFGMYILFIIFEVGFYLIFLLKKREKYPFFVVTVCELLIIPLLIVRDYNFIMRGSIPALFMLMLYVIDYMMDDTNYNRFKVLICVFLCVGSISGLSEISRSVTNTIKDDNYLKTYVETFDELPTEEQGLIYTYGISEQFFVKNYENKFFYKYISNIK